MIGTQLGPYRIDRALGSGGMGKVYAAIVAGHHATLPVGTRVALKVVHPHLVETPEFFRRFQREVEIGKAVVHENVVRTLDCDEASIDGTLQHYLVMEYVEGQTLRGLLAELERVPEELCRHIGREVAKGLGAIHAAGVVHRDVKPENVLITEDHVVKLMDLGVARLTDEVQRLSQTGMFVGSIEYAAPECFDEGGRHVDGRTDLHALGLVLYELACGTNPYRAEGVPQILMAILHSEPRRLGDVNPQLSPFYEEAVHRLLAKKPEDRFADAAAVLAVLSEGEASAWWKDCAKGLRAATHRPLRRIRIPRETAVYGREAELARLSALYARAKAGEGQVVLIEGEAGIGKSRLVDELVGRLQRDGEELSFLFGSYPPNGAATASGAFSSAYREQFGVEGCVGYLPQSPVLVPAFDALLRGESAARGAEPLTKDSLQTCFAQATRALAAERTTVVLIDDLHFAPEEGRALFTSLAMAIEGHRVLLVGTTRPGVPGEWLAGLRRLEQTTQMTLARLGPKDLAALLKDCFRSEPLALGLAGQIGVKSDGNPFFAFEIIRGLREGQFITQRDDGSWVTTRVIEDIRIPASVLDLVNARVADLLEEERDLLDVACCWGFEFDPGLVGDVLGMGRIPLLKRFGQIERAHRLVRASGRNYVFDHHQVQEALYGSLHEQMREEYHAALATALEARAKAADRAPEAVDGALCVDLCEHFLRGAQGARALRYLPAAQAYLEKGYLNAQVISLAERALAAPGLLVGADRARTLLRLCGATGPLDRLGLRARQEAAAREAERLAGEAGDEELRGWAAQALGSVLDRTSRPAEAGEAFGRALAIARARGDRSAEASVEGGWGNVFYSEGRYEEARERYERQLTLSGELADRRGEATATGNLGLVFSAQGRLTDARRLYERHLALSREIGDRQGEGAATGNLGTVFYAQGRLAMAREQYERHLALSQEIGDRRSESNATGNLGNVCSSQGRLEEARAHHERDLALSREIGDRQGEAIALHNLGNVLREIGETALAKERLLACLALSEAIGVRHVAAATHLVLGTLRSGAGEMEGGRASLVAARDLAAKSGLPGYETLARCHLACLPGGDVPDALAALASNEDRLEPEERREARWLLWKATGDRAHLAEAKRLLDEALSNAAPEDREAMLASLRLNRDIAAAAKETAEPR